MANERKFVRRHTPTNLVAFSQIACKGYGDLCDISQGGLRLRTLSPLEPGSIDLLFKLPPAKAPLRFQGQVVWMWERPSRDFDIGIEFVLPNTRVTNVIERFFESR